MSKIENLMKSLPEGIDAALIASGVNRKYYTGFSSSAGVLFVTREKAYFIIDFRYIEAARANIKDCEVILRGKFAEQIRELCERHNVKTVGTENTYMTVTTFKEYESQLAPAKLVDLPAVDELILSHRRYKTEAELVKVRQAQALTDETFSHILGVIRPGLTEKEVALEMEFYMRKRGADAVSFDFIVASGPNSSKPHAVPSDRVIQKGDFLTMDFGADVDGYHSDMTRTVAIGSVSEKQQHVYDTVLKAQLAGIEAIKIGTPCVDVDKAARDLIYAAGYEGCFGHSLGHSVGVEIHEAPSFAESSKAVVEANLLMTVEPGIYLAGEYGVRIEDMVFITADRVENLTFSDKKLIIL